MPPESQAIQKVHPAVTFAQYVNARKGSLGAIMPKVLNLERVTKVAIACYARTPKLWECTLTSVYEAIQQSVQLGLEPGGPLGHAYLVPYKDKCTLIVGYKGLIALARRSGEIATIEAHVAYEKDSFEMRFGTDGFLRHTPNFEVEDQGAPKVVYALATLRDGTKQWDVMTIPEVNKIRDGSPGAKSTVSPWHGYYTEMARKTVIRRLCKYLPMSVELAEAIDHEEQVDSAAMDVSGLAVAAMDPETPALTEGAIPVTAQPQTASETAELRHRKPAQQRTQGTNEIALRKALANASTQAHVESIRQSIKNYESEFGPAVADELDAILGSVCQDKGLK